MTTAKIKLRITTCVKPNRLILNYLKCIVTDVKTYSDVNYEVIERKKLTIKNLFEEDTTPVMVIQQTGVVLYTSDENKIFIMKIPHALSIKLMLPAIMYLLLLNLFRMILSILTSSSMPQLEWQMI